MCEYTSARRTFYLKSLHVTHSFLSKRSMLLTTQARMLPGRTRKDVPQKGASTALIKAVRRCRWNWLSVIGAWYERVLSLCPRHNRDRLDSLYRKSTSISLGAACCHTQAIGWITMAGRTETDSEIETWKSRMWPSVPIRSRIHRRRFTSAPWMRSRKICHVS